MAAAAEKIRALVDGNGAGAARRHLMKVGALEMREKREIPAPLGHLWDWFLNWVSLQISVSADQPMAEIITDMQMLAGVAFRPPEIRLLSALVKCLRVALAQKIDDPKRPRPLF